MLLIGDVGGTNTRLALVSPEKSLREAVVEEQFSCNRYSSLEAVVKEFLSRHNCQADQAVFGVAGPVSGGRSQITNLPWVIDEKQLAAECGFKKVSLLNDLAAMAEAIPFLLPEDIVVLNEGRTVPQAPIAVIAPGTGLGEAYLIHNGTRYESHATEGGHTDFAPTNELELALLGYMLKRFEHVSYERLCSGSGLPNIFDFVKDTQGLSLADWLVADLKNAADPTPVIVKAAREHRSEICELTLKIFLDILAAETANLALKIWGSGGIYLGGGIPPRFIDLLKEPLFLKNMAKKGRFKEAIENMPVKVIMNTRANLIGAAHYAMAHQLV